ncbi:hypothetical protein JCM19236_1890 [Vibrio sp. JCM 19236]|nr:hypothetical protein JCM19236_1890 [Vibrio sp. JCM 19236]
MLKKANEQGCSKCYEVGYGQTARISVLSFYFGSFSQQPIS